MSKSRLPLYLGLGAAAAGGYYLYSAGGDPKKATKNLEDDASRAASRLRSDASGEKQEVNESERAAEKLDKVQRDRLKIAQADNVRDKARRVDQRTTETAKNETNRLNRVRQDVAKDLTEKVDNFDKAVEKKVSEAKGGILSWFGGKK